MRFSEIHEAGGWWDRAKEFFNPQSQYQARPYEPDNTGNPIDNNAESEFKDMAKRALPYWQRQSTGDKLRGIQPDANRFYRWATNFFKVTNLPKFAGDLNNNDDTLNYLAAAYAQKYSDAEDDAPVAAPAPEPAAAPAAPEPAAAPSAPKPAAAPAAPARKRGDIVQAGQTVLQYTGDPGKEWFVAGGPLQQPNPTADRYNNIQTVGGKKFISAADAKRNLQVERKLAHLNRMIRESKRLLDLARKRKV